MRGGGDLRRKAGSRQPRKRFLVYCEGKVTEVVYLKGLRTELRSGNLHIEIGNEHAEPLRLVKEAIAHARRSRQRGDEPYDQIWCVFDVEAPAAHPNLEEALKLAGTSDVRCAVSNPCFELWLLLHFVNRSMYLTTTEACRLLEKHLDGYSLDRKSFRYDTVRAHYAMARTRAVELDDRHGVDRGLRDRNPWSSVWTLVDELRRDAVR